MRKRGIVWLSAVCIMVIFCGCGKISNDKLTINKYKNLEIAGESSNSDLESKVWEALVRNSEVKEYPKGMVEEYIEDLKSQYSSYAEMYDITLEEAVEKEYGVSIQQVAEDMVCKELAIELIAEKEHLEVSEDDYEEELTGLAAEYDFDDPEEFEEFVGKDKVKEALLRKRVTEFLLEHSK